MSNTELRVTPGQFTIWGVVLIGLWAAFMLGNMIAADDYTKVVLNTLAVVSVIAILTIRRYWWIPIFMIGVFSIASEAPGFKLEGTDVMSVFAFGCLVAMFCMKQLRTNATEHNLGIFFYLLLIYILGHAVLYGVDNYFNGDTQFKNIAKRYYITLMPLILIWCMDRFAYQKGIRRTLDWMIILTIIFSIAGVFVLLFDIPIPGISGTALSFAWANTDLVAGYLRWTIMPVLFLSLCLISSVPPKSGRRFFYSAAFWIMLPAVFCGGGRMALVMVLLFVVTWLAIRRKFKEVVFGAWLMLMAAGGLLILGHSIDARKLQELPKPLQSVERAISIFLPADQVNQGEVMTGLSDQWHQDLATGSWDYANEDYKSMIFGHGFKGWDDSIDINMFTYGAAYESAVKIAIRMGASETLFFSTLAIFGWVGVVLFYGFMIELMRRNLKVRKLCPEGSLGRSLCEFSFCLILVTLLVSPLTGAIPSYNIIFWMIGFLAAEPYLAKIAPHVIPSAAPGPIGVMGVPGRAPVPARPPFGPRPMPIPVPGMRPPFPGMPLPPGQFPGVGGGLRPVPPGFKPMPPGVGPR